jgi:LPXTG-site transpeptidase (sortase) family protein
MKSRWGLLLAGAVLATVTGCGAATATSTADAGTPRAPASVSTDVDTSTPRSRSVVPLPGITTPTVTAAPAVGVPARLRIPTLHVDARVKTTTEKDGAVVVPENITSTGWDNQTSQVGGTGSTLIVGHRDSTTADGALHDLEDLKKGDVVSVVVKAGGTRVYRVTTLRTYDKDHLPADIFSKTGEHRLTLVTCGGRLVPSKADGLLHWSSNVVLTASPTP